jgi:hypothetical protein
MSTTFIKLYYKTVEPSHWTIINYSQDSISNFRLMLHKGTKMTAMALLCYFTSHCWAIGQESSDSLNLLCLQFSLINWLFWIFESWSPKMRQTGRQYKNGSVPFIAPPIKTFVRPSEQRGNRSAPSTTPFLVLSHILKQYIIIILSLQTKWEARFFSIKNLTSRNRAIESALKDVFIPFLS